MTWIQDFVPEPAWVCDECKHIVDSAFNACTYCGVSRPERVEVTGAMAEVRYYWRCWNCGTDVLVGDDECHSCGADPVQPRRVALDPPPEGTIEFGGAERPTGLEEGTLQTGYVGEAQWRAEVLLELRAISAELTTIRMHLEKPRGGIY